MPKHRWRHKNPHTPAEAARRAKYNSPEHRAARAHYTPLVAAGIAHCWRPDCRARLVPGRWHVGHNDPGDQIMGPECDTCNRTHAARKGNRIAKAKRAAQTFVRPTR